jgi:hypothetical protein
MIISSTTKRTTNSKGWEGAPLCAESFGSATTIHQHKPVNVMGLEASIKVGASIHQNHHVSPISKSL